MEETQLFTLMTDRHVHI